MTTRGRRIGALMLVSLAAVVGCDAPEPASLCDQIELLDGSGAPRGPSRAERKQRCVDEMSQAQRSRPEEYRCWSRCIVEVSSWDEARRCDECVSGNYEIDPFRVNVRSKTSDR